MKDTSAGPSTADQTHQVPTTPSPVRRTGYVIAIVVNALLLYVVNNLLAWDVLPFLTQDFERLLPILNLSIVASIAANALYLWRDRGTIRHGSQIIVSALSLGVMVRTWQIYPFDFSAYSVNWDVLVRFILVVAVVGTSIGLVAEAVKLVRGTEA